MSTRERVIRKGYIPHEKPVEVLEPELKPEEKPVVKHPEPVIMPV